MLATSKTHDADYSILSKPECVFAAIWHNPHGKITSEAIAEYYEVEVEKIFDVVDLHHGELDDAALDDDGWTPRGAIWLGLLLDSPVATSVRSLALDVIEAHKQPSKKAAVRFLLENAQFVEWSNREIAKILGCSHTVVNSVRRRLESDGKIVKFERRKHLQKGKEVERKTPLAISAINIPLDKFAVYFIQANGTNFFKIGYTNDIQKRLQTIASGCPYHLEIRHYLVCDDNDSATLAESWLHERFALSRARGNAEWFTLTDEDISDLKDTEVCKLLQSCGNCFHLQPSNPDSSVEHDAKVTVSSQLHPRHGQQGVIVKEWDGHWQKLIRFSDGTEESIADTDLDAQSVAFTPTAPIERKNPPPLRTYTEDELRAEINRAIAESKIGLKVKAEERAIASVGERLIASQAIAQSKGEEVIKLKQKIMELESLRLLEAENQRLLQRIQDLENSQQPRHDWGNTFTKQAEKVINTQVQKQIEQLEPELHLRSLAVNPPTENQSGVVKLLGLSLEATAQSMPRFATELRKAAAIILQVDEESLEQRAFQLRHLPEAIASIKQVLSLPDVNWGKFTQVSDNYPFIKQEIWMGLNLQEREKINQMKQEILTPSSPQRCTEQVVVSPVPSPQFTIDSRVLTADKYSTRANIPGTVIGIENEMLLVHWDDCDRPLFQHRYEFSELRLVEVAV